MSVEIAADVWNEIQRQLATGTFASRNEAPAQSPAPRSVSAATSWPRSAQASMTWKRAASLPSATWIASSVSETVCLRPNDLRSPHHPARLARSPAGFAQKLVLHPRSAACPLSRRFTSRPTPSAGPRIPSHRSPSHRSNNAANFNQNFRPPPGWIHFVPSAHQGLTR